MLDGENLQGPSWVGRMHRGVCMKWASTISTKEDPAAAVAQVIAEATRALAGAKPDLAVLFVSPHHGGAYPAIAGAVAGELEGAAVIGCSGGGVIGGAREVERSPAVALAVGSLPDVTVTPFSLQAADFPQSGDTDAWCRLLGLESRSPVSLLLLPDPFSFEAEPTLDRLDAAFPATTIVGGLASGATQPGESALFVGNATLRSGMVGVALDGSLRVDSVVAQGCRPIGDPMFVTGSERNLVRQLDGRPAFEVLKELVDTLPPADLELARHSLFVGLVMRRNREQYGPGDFLIRNLIGVDAESGVVGVGGLVEDGAVLQFHLRDAATSAEDLGRMLGQYESQVDSTPSAALLFSCLGRGVGLYGRADHDTGMVRERFGDIPVGGFFCNGEIGPVQGRTYLHGYTSSFAMFRGVGR